MMEFKVRVNNGVLVRGNYHVQLRPKEKQALDEVETYKQLKQIKEKMSDDHKKMVTLQKLELRDAMQIHKALKDGKKIPWVKKQKRGCFTTYTFKLS